MSRLSICTFSLLWYAERTKVRIHVEGVTVHGFRSTFRDWAGEVANAPREVAEMSLARKVGNDVERAYDHALANGANAVKAPMEMPWGQTVSFVSDPDGILIEICSPVTNSG